MRAHPIPLGIAVVVAALVALGVLSGHITFFMTKGDVEPTAEARYRDVISRDARALAPLNAALDACNIGGTRQGCYDASNQMLVALNALLHDLETTHVPSRFVDGNKDLRRGVERLAEGFRTRNTGIATNDNTLFVRGNDEIRAADGDIKSAWGRFPPDARLALGLSP